MKKVALVLILAACGSDPDSVLIDASPSPDAIPQGPNTVSLRTFGGPQLVMYRDGAGPWLVPLEVSIGNYELRVTDAYEVVLACSTTGASDVVLHRQTFGDGATRYGFCDVPSSDPAPMTVQVTGQMAQAGQVYMTDMASSTTAPWTFMLDVTPGTHDLVAVGTNNRILVRRDVTVSAAATLPAVDVVADGVAMTPVPLTINNGVHGGEVFSTDFYWSLRNSSAFLTGASTTLQTPPASLVDASDFTFLSLYATTDAGWRYAFTSFTGAETTFTLPAAPSGITYAEAGGALMASWGTTPDYTELELSLAATSASNDRRLRVVASRAWLAATGLTQIGFDADPPGFDPSWNIDLAGPYVRMLTVSDNSGTISYGSTLREAVNAAVLRPLPPRARQREIEAARRAMARSRATP